MNTARHRAALLVLSLRAFHHSTNIGSGIDLIDDLEVGENLPRRKLFDFLLVQTVEPIKERPLVRRQFRMLFGARHALVSDDAPAEKCVPCYLEGTFDYAIGKSCGTVGLMLLDLPASDLLHDGPDRQAQR
jgi:hypothetical protein